VPLWGWPYGWPLYQTKQNKEGTMPGIIHDLGQVLRVQTTVPTLLTATSTATSKDMLLGEGRCTLLVDVGTYNATSCTVQVTECATTNGTYTNITGASISITTQSVPLSVTFDRTLRYLGTVVTVSGTTIGYSASVVQAYKKF
jgi:hypothetical protein